MDKETISRLVLGEIEKIKNNDRRHPDIDRSLKSDNSRAQAVLLFETPGAIDRNLEAKLKSANFDPVTDISRAGEAKMLVLTDLSHRNLSYICEGIDDGEYASAVIDGILKGVEIILIEEGIKYKNYLNSSNKNFYEMMRKKERLLSTYGVKTMKEKDFVSYLEKNFSSPTSSEGETLFNRKLLTEEDAICLYKSGVLEINTKAGVIITPLAKDYIRENNMSIRYRGH